jgi:hypothetical protein
MRLILDPFRQLLISFAGCLNQHQRHYLSWSEAGRTRMLYIPRAQLKGFQGGVRAWVEFKRLAQELARYNARRLKSQESHIP